MVTFNLVVECIYYVYFCINATDGEELAIPRRIGCFLTMEVKAAILNRETGKRRLATTPTSERHLRDVCVLREIDLCVNNLYSFCSQETCQESKKSK